MPLLTGPGGSIAFACVTAGVPGFDRRRRLAKPGPRVLWQRGDAAPAHSHRNDAGPTPDPSSSQASGIDTAAPGRARVE